MEAYNASWNLQSFVDSLVVELDKARDALSVKALNQPMSYSVKDLALDLQVFPQFDGDTVFFQTAKPGESGSSKISLQLVSTSDRAIRESSRPPVTKDDGRIDNLPGMNPEKKKALEKVGIRTVKDVERMERNQVSLEEVTDGKIDYGGLSDLLKKARRRDNPPSVMSVSGATTAEGLVYTVFGKNLETYDFERPLAWINGQECQVMGAHPDKITLKPIRSFSKQQSLASTMTCHLLLDTDTILRFDILNT